MSNFCNCGSHSANSKVCCIVHCGHKFCTKHSAGGGACICHFKKVNTREKLCDAIKDKKNGYWFYIGSSGKEGKDFHRYILKPKVCTTKYFNHDEKVKTKDNGKKVKATTVELDECYFWDKSTDMETSEQYVFDFAYKEKFDKYTWGLNDELMQSQERKMKRVLFMLDFIEEKM
jgi:hypothetical protein